MNKSWCLSYREFPEVFKTPLTFYPTFNMKAVIANQDIKLWATSFALGGCTVGESLNLDDVLLPVHDLVEVVLDHQGALYAHVEGHGLGIVCGHHHSSGFS